VGPEVQTTAAEEVSDLILPARDYRATQILVPGKLHTGLDRILHAAIGRYRSGPAVLRRMQEAAEQIVDRSLELSRMAEGKLRDRLGATQAYFRRQSKEYEVHLPEALALLVEASSRTLGLRPHPVQVLGALALWNGYLAEMATGEGKSLTASLAGTLAGWTDRPCHIITVNDYLAGRDADSMRPLYSFCGVSVGWVSSTMAPEERRINYEKGVVYTTSKELLADFLRDRLKLGPCDQASRRLIRRQLQSRSTATDELVMRGIDTVIVDEADSVLIDEAVTPLIISHPQPNDPLLEACRIAHEIAETLGASIDYRVDPKYREITLTEKGREKIEILAADRPGLWQGRVRREEWVTQALMAREFYNRNQQYVVQDGEVVIVDEFTGRLMPQRTWQHGLHQAVEAREGVELSEPNETLARLSFQRFFRFFRKLSGMTGTASEAASEFWQIYRLPILRIPTHRPCMRKQLPDKICPDQRTKWVSILEEIARCHETGRPVLVGTRSVKASENLASMLAEQGLSFNLLNAVRHKEEAAIVAGAGQRGAITIATNMAGRGTDIKLARGVAELGGLHVIATERHESSRIDRQLFGRAGRQGDPGSAQAFISLQDELIMRFVPATIGGWFSFAVVRLAFRQRRGVLHTDTWLADALSFTGSNVDR
jgi:preprotein translocase subunit SecA